MAGFGLQKTEKKRTRQRSIQAKGEALLKTAVKLHLGGDLLSAEKAYREAMETGYLHPSIFSNLGVICKNSGRIDQAVKLFDKAIKTSPNDPNAYTNLGNLHKDLGQLDKALAATQKSLELNPDNPNVLINLGGIYQDLGQLDKALAATQKSLELKPDNPNALINLGGIYKELIQLDKALAATQKSLELKPDNPNALINLGGIYKELGQLDQALAAYRRGNALKPKDLKLAVASSLFFSDLYKDQREIDIERHSYLEGIKSLAEKSNLLERSDINYSTEMFWIAYHNKDDDKNILEALGRTVQSLQSQNIIETGMQKKTNLENKKPIKIGICSDYLRMHTIGNLYSGIIRSLKRNGFHVIIFRGPESKTDMASQEIEGYANSSVRLPASLTESCSIVKHAHLDVLIYPDIGMSPYTYMLAIHRLAPVQVTSWGHPNTTGLDTIDYFLSTHLIEPEDAQSYYTERLIQLNKLPCIYPASKIKIGKKSKSKFQLPLDQILIGIPQSLFKFHPDYDEVLEGIISRLQNTKFILIEGSNKPMTTRLKSRWAEKAPKTLNNTIFLPRMSQQDYLCLLDTVDILLDPIYFGSGNTFYEAMAIGTPLVTMPGSYMRGRIVAGGYKQIGLDNAPIAANINEYIEISVRLSEDADFRRSIKQQIKSSAAIHLFDDQDAADEIIKFIHAAVDCRRETGGLLPIEWSPST